MAAWGYEFFFKYPLFYAFFWKYVQINMSVAWLSNYVPGKDLKSAQPASIFKCICFSCGMRKWLSGKLSLHEKFCSSDLF